MIVVACAVFQEGKMLLSRRQSDFLLCPPAGKREKGETLRDGAARELLEETGLVTKYSDLKEIGFCERLDKYQIVFWYLVTEYQGVPTTMEPEKHGKWMFRDIPPDDQCIPGMRLFKAKLLKGCV